jgi:hypothetical protein
VFKGGKYTVADKGTVVIHGKYTISGDKITFGHETGPDACGPSGTYVFKLSGAKLKFTRIKESSTCIGRSTVLAGPFAKIG